MEAERREKGLLKTSKRASNLCLAVSSYSFPEEIFPTGTRARVATTMSRIESLSRLSGGWSRADLDVTATGAAKERLSRRAMATSRADRVQRRATHRGMREGDVLTVARD